MSTDIEKLRRLAQYDVKNHTAIFDLYATVGRDVEYLAIKFGMEPGDVIDLLEGYGEKISTGDPQKPYDFSNCGRYSKLHRVLVEEYIEKFYPGISSENPQNDWMCFEEYLNKFHPAWKEQVWKAYEKEEKKQKKEKKKGFKLY
ncbi:MAG: hypothetical protein GX663_09865 [Clostridiales bacterium]|nr:hypothetical protein [Clostridiales bacterium]